ncbi:MAG: hypothetical protein ACRC4L_03825 [Mycoplasma sp.]
MEWYLVLQQIVAPLITSLVAVSGALILLSSYYFVFKLRKYARKVDIYYQNLERMSKSYNSSRVLAKKSPILNFTEIELEANRKTIQEMITKIKTADLKDIILGTYKKDIQSIKRVANQSYQSITKNINLIKFLRLFHVQNEGGVEIVFFNNEYFSFYTIEKYSVSIYLIKKEEYTENMLCEDFNKKASVYQLFFFRKSFLINNISNPIKEFEVKLDSIKNDYKYVVSKKLSIYNIYLHENFKNVPKYKKSLSNVLMRKEKYIYERISNKSFVDDESFVKLQNRLNDIKLLKEKS